MTEFQSTLWTVIHGAGRGDESALRDFTLKYRAPVVAYIRRRGLLGEAEDIAQEVFLRVIQDDVLTKADPSKGRFRSLILAVTRHVIGHHLERQRAQKRGGGQVKQLGDFDVAEQTPDDTFDQEWVAHLIEVALARLARDHANYHTALRMFLMEERPYVEIAREMKKSEGDIKNYIHRGKKKLIEQLKSEVRDYSSSRAEYAEELRYLAKFLPR